MKGSFVDSPLARSGTWKSSRRTFAPCIGCDQPIEPGTLHVYLARNHNPELRRGIELCAGCARSEGIMR